MAHTQNALRPKSEGAELKEKAQDMGSNIAEKARDFGSNVADKARDASQKAGDMATQAARKAGDVASEMGNKASDVACDVGHKADDATHAVGQSMQTLAGTIREKAPHGGMIGSASTTVADTLEKGGRYIEEQGLRGMGSDLTELIRRNPIPALFLGIGLGFLIAQATTRR